MADITWQRPEFKSAIDDWSLCIDASEGERKIKEGKTKYLPKPNPEDTSIQNDNRYDQYILRANFFPATGRTKKGLVSLVYRKPPTISLPSHLDYARQNIDGEGNSIEKQSQKVLSRLLITARHGLFVDYPQSEEVKSRLEKQQQNLRASIVSIRAEQITNWRTESVGGSQVLTLVVIKEQAEEKNGFATEVIDQYRELSLVNNVYTVTVWRKIEDKEEWYQFEAPYEPRDGRGNTWEVIPFQFVGAENNDSNIDEAPLLDLARVNIAHYRNSADYEDSVYLTGQVQPVITGLDEQWADRLEKSGVYVGSRSAFLLPEGATYTLAQAAPNMVVKEAMDAKEKQMVSIGAHLIEKGSAVKTATQQDSEDAVSHSVVSLCASNLSDAYEQCMKWVAAFEKNAVNGEINDDDFQFELSQDYTSKHIDPNMLNAVVAAWQQGAYAKYDLRNFLRKKDLIAPHREDEDIDEEIDNESPGLPLDGSNPFLSVVDDASS